MSEQKTVAYYIEKSGMIKFINDDIKYKLGEMDKVSLNKGDNVEVETKDGIVTSLKKLTEGKGSEEAYISKPKEEAVAPASPVPETKKDEPKVEASKIEKPISSLGSEDAIILKELTVFAVAANKKVVKFTEIKDDGWYQISEDIQKMDYPTIGLIAKNKVRVTFVDKIVTSLVKVASELAEQAKTQASSPSNVKVDSTPAQAATSTYTPAQAVKKEWKPASTYDTAEKQTSIEAQSSINAACQVVGMMAANIDPKPTANVLNSMISAIAKENYNLLQELKNKKS
jgi:hypothetical protein